MTITLTREEAQQVLDALECMNEGALNAEIKLLRARLAQPEPEPVAWMDVVGSLYHFKEYDTDKPLYTAPPQREWQGLEIDEVKATAELGIYEKPLIDFARAIEAKLKEKNAP